tara:strand:- start:111 stop:329 length:219 start_codon:yes stop_codon:yes gene_type:complete
MKVKANSFYKFCPVMWDVLDPKTDLKDGDIVQVIKIPGCPAPNTMSHAHVYFEGQFAGLVHVNSLMKIKEKK